MKSMTSRAARFLTPRTGICASLLVLACGGGDAASEAADEPVPAPLRTSDEPLAPSGQPGAVSPAAPAPEPASPALDNTAAPANEPQEGPAPAPEPAALCGLSLTFDDQYAAVAADLRRAGAGDAPFLRYLSLGNRLNQGLCPEALEPDRLALIKALNSLSTEVNIALPEAIDDDGVLYRIDLRDLGWEQPTEVGGVAFTDKWEAIIATSPYAVELEGDDADEAKLEALTAVPLLFADALVDVTVVGDLYYALVDIGVSALDLFTQLGIDFADDDIVRAGTRQGRMSQQDTIMQRFAPGARQGFYWSRFDVADTTVGQSILADPFGFQGDVVASLFTLPNGFIAYALFDNTFTRVAETAVLVDRFQRDGLVRNSVSCSGCHSAGVNFVTDEVGPFVATNRFEFDADTLQEVEDSFLPQTELNDVIARDNAMYEAALTRAGLPMGAVDPVHQVFQRFDDRVTLAVAAGELGTTAEELDEVLGTLSRDADPQLAVLRTGSLDRAQFEGAYVAALCSLLVNDENRPVAAECGVP